MVAKPTLLGGASFSPGGRSFIYEVEGLKQTLQSDRTDYSIRSSEKTFVTVPLSRMNEEMRRITRLGGKIVGVRSASQAAEQETTQANEDAD